MVGMVIQPTPVVILEPRTKALEYNSWYIDGNCKPNEPYQTIVAGE